MKTALFQAIFCQLGYTAADEEITAPIKIPVESQKPDLSGKLSFS